MNKLFDEVESDSCWRSFRNLRELVSHAETEREMLECLSRCTALIQRLEEFDESESFCPALRKSIRIRDIKPLLQDAQEHLMVSIEKFMSCREEQVNEALWSLDRIESYLTAIIRAWEDPTYVQIVHPDTLSFKEIKNVS